MFAFTPTSTVQLGFFELSTHGLLIALGFLIAVILARREAGKREINIALVDNVAILAVFAGLVGARIFWVLSFGQGMSFIEMLSIWQGGMSSHGGYIFGIVAGLLYVKYKKANVLKFADAVLPYLLIGWAIGRVGCFLNWDSFGKITTVPWAVIIAGESRHATQLYESLGCLITFFVYHRIQRSRKFVIKGKGVEAAIALIGFAFVRFVVDFWRADSFEYLLMSRFITIAIIVSSVAWIMVQYNKYARRS